MGSPGGAPPCPSACETDLLRRGADDDDSDDEEEVRHDAAPITVVLPAPLPPAPNVTAMLGAKRGSSKRRVHAERSTWKTPPRRRTRGGQSR